jgi:hypothetical protein
VPNKNFFTLDRFRDKPRSSTSPLVIEHPRRVAGNLEVTSSPVGLVPTNALILSGLVNFRVVGYPEVIRFICHAARWPRFFRSCLAASNFRSRSA